MMIAMVVIGPEKLPETAASIGKWVREFRRVTTELTQQFSDENPFTEIQRAFSLTELTNSLNAPFPTAEAPPALVEASAPAPEAVPVTSSAVVAAASSSIPIRSYYFDQPAMSVPVEDTWTHSGLDDDLERYGVRLKPLLTDEIVDDWAHGVPQFVETPATAEAPTDAMTSAETVQLQDPAESTSADLDESAANIEPSIDAGDDDGSATESGILVPIGESSFLDDVEVRVPPTSQVAGDGSTAEPVAVGAAGSVDRSKT